MELRFISTNTVLFLLTFILSLVLLVIIQSAGRNDTNFISFTKNMINYEVLEHLENPFPEASIPFYIYNSSDFQWIENCTINPGNILKPSKPPNLSEHFQKQHGNDQS